MSRRDKLSVENKIPNVLHPVGMGYWSCSRIDFSTNSSSLRDDQSFSIFFFLLPIVRPYGTINRKSVQSVKSVDSIRFAQKNKGDAKRRPYDVLVTLHSSLVTLHSFYTNHFGMATLPGFVTESNETPL
jgi:hypothetical protein